MKRLFYLDWLRVIATIAVVSIHVTAGAGSVGQMQPHHHLEWLEANLFETLSRWSVPAFVMISGALLLNDQRVISIGGFLKKRAAKVIIPFVGWSILFYLYGVYTGYFPASLRHAVKLFFTNGISYHLWFLYMIVGMYLITPLMQKFVKNASKQNIQYFLLLWLYASIATRLMDYYIHVHLNIELFYVSEYAGYFLLGYYLANYDISKRWRMISYLGGILGFACTFAFSYYYTLKGNGMLDDFWYGYFSPFVLLSVVGLFVWFRYRFQEWDRPLPLVFRWVNQTSLGIYILHYWLMNNFLWKVYPNVIGYFHSILSLPINILLTLVLSLFVTLVLKQIPLVKKLVP